MPRQRISLDGTWDFWKDPTGMVHHDQLPDGLEAPIQVPGPWQVQPAGRDLRFGVGWYRRVIDLPDPKSDRLILGFDAADRVTEVWWNGQFVGRHEGGYLPFEMDITGAVQPGQNRLVVRVEDRAEDFFDSPHGKQSWYGQLSGLWQPVWLEQRPDRHLLGMQITPSGENVLVDVRMNRPLLAGQRLQYLLSDGAGEPVASGAAETLSFSFSVSRPWAWDLDHPHLYRLTVRLEGGESDEIASDFGFRTIQARGGRLLLNGRPLLLRAALDQDYYPEMAYTPPSEEMIEDQLRKAKAMGLNCLRVHIKPADPRYYAIADRLGLLIWTELPNWKYLTPEARRRGWETMEAILQRDWNHPSIIIWTIIHENWGTDLSHNADHRMWLAETYSALKARDPLRLVVDNSACYGNFHVVTDIEDFHNYYAIPDNAARWQRWVTDFANRAPWTFTPQFDGVEDWKRYLQAPWEPLERPYAPEVHRTGQEPLVVSEFGNWGLPDLHQLLACYDGKDPAWFETGYEWDQGVVYPHGVEQRFADYALDTVFGDLSGLARASQWAQFAALKYEIEQIRRHESISGYVITEFTDVHWECNGLLDMCRNPKAHFDRLGEINAQDMLIPEGQKLAFWPGDVVQMDVLLSHFSSQNLEGSRLTWRLADFPDIAGQVQGLSPRQYGVTPIGQVAFSAPEIARSQAVPLIFELHDPAGRLCAQTSQELYFVPPLELPETPLPIWAPDMQEILKPVGLQLAGRLSDASIAISYHISEDLYRFAQAGGQVLWLAEGPLPGHAFLGPPTYPLIQPRRGTPLEGNWASSLSWIRKGALFTDLPTENTVNFAFAGLTPENIITGVSTLEFAQRVHAGIFAGWVQKNAALVCEFPLGQGRVLVNTFRISEEINKHPVATAMFQQMLNYLA